MSSVAVWWDAVVQVVERKPTERFLSTRISEMWQTLPEPGKMPFVASEDFAGVRRWICQCGGKQSRLTTPYPATHATWW